MRNGYLHLWVFPCDSCAGPVVAGSTAIRENEISKETNIRQVGAICLSCGHRQDKSADLGRVRHLPPISWILPEPADEVLAGPAFTEALNHAERH
jgi:hypothetical protein